MKILNNWTIVFGPQTAVYNRMWIGYDNCSKHQWLVGYVLYIGSFEASAQDQDQFLKDQDQN